MRKLVTNVLGCALWVAWLCLGAAPGAAQDPGPKKEAGPVAVYRVDFSIQELENGKKINTRNYSMLLQARPMREADGGTHRVVSKVPLQTEKGTQYLDVGLKIDCRLEEREDALLLETSFQISDFATPAEAKGTGTPPVIREIFSRVQTAIPAGKPTLISTVDDTATKRRYAVEVTAVKVN